MPFLNERIRVETREVSPTIETREVLPFFEIWRSQTTDIGVLRNRARDVSPTPFLQVLKALHVYRKTCPAPDKVRKALNGVEVKRLRQHIKDLKDLRVFGVALCYRY